MRLINSISNWMESQNNKRMTRMKEQGRCPDCSGSGFNSMVLEHTIGMSMDGYHCASCSGSGLFSDWAQTTQHNGE